ncbi:MAG: aldehyde ferredoxin oxidoreductase N-terminal domain-containing protein [Dehalococcoidales bacterium]|jgi:aldehyde:ferredoxin oxidoreductase
MNGWMGKILQVNLSTGTISEIDTRPYADKYLGGRGIGVGLYWEKVKPETGAFDPENCLIFTTGPIVGSSAQGATLTSVVGKSPATIPEGFCYGNLTGFVGAELKKAGYDGLVVEGKASRPTYIFIEDGRAELRDAAGLWGQNGYRTGELLEQIHGAKTRFIAIGAAGEHLVRTAVALASHDCTVSAGFGAVMGSKNLKAIAIRGSGKVEVADLEKLHELNRYTIKISKRVRLSIPPRIEHTKYAELLEVIGKGNCYLCGLECVAGVYRYGKKLIGHRKCQSVEYYLPWVYGQEDEPIETFFNAPVMANDYGFDSWEMTNIIEWLYAGYRTGALTEAETGLPLSRIGTAEFLEKLMRAIAYREGFGDILAEGLVRAGEKISPKARALFPPTLAPIGANYAFSPRTFPIMALLYPPEPRVHHVNYHDIAFVHIAWSIEQQQPGVTGVTGPLVHRIAREFWGSDTAGDFSSYEGKALAAKIIQHRTYLKEMLGLCDWGYPISYSFNTPDHMGDPDIEAKICTAVTGIPGEELDIYAERVYNLQRLILLREGRQTPAADYPMDFIFTEPQRGMPGAGIMVPGPGDSAVDMVGNKLDRDKFTAMLKEYYTLRGWDEETGLPRAETLAALGLGDMAKALAVQ